MAETDTQSGSGAADAPANAPATSASPRSDQSPADAATTHPQHDLSPANDPTGTTTRDDATDASVPMVPTDGDEPQGPEDALGTGPKRGDYRGRQPEGAVHLTGEAIPEDELERDEDGVVVPHQPLTRLRVQNHETHNIGDVPGKKGGVTTTAADKAVNTEAVR